jgi:hypothetical protein
MGRDRSLLPDSCQREAYNWQLVASVSAPHHAMLIIEASELREQAGRSRRLNMARVQ